MLTAGQAYRASLAALHHVCHGVNSCWSSQRCDCLCRGSELLQKRAVGRSGEVVKTRSCEKLSDAYLYATSPHIFVGPTQQAGFARVRDKVCHRMHPSRCHTSFELWCWGERWCISLAQRLLLCTAGVTPRTGMHAQHQCPSTVRRESSCCTAGVSQGLQSLQSSN